MTRSPCPTPRPLSPRAPPSHSASRHFSSRTSAPLATRHDISCRAFARSSLLMSPPFVPPRAARSPACAKPTAVGRARICVSKTGKYSIKRRKLLYFFAFFKVLFEKNPLNSRGEKIPQVFLSSCSSEAISRFSGGERTLLRAFRPPPFRRDGSAFSARSFYYVVSFAHSFLASHVRLRTALPAQKQSPAACGALLLFFNSFADGLAPSPTADAFLPAMV